MESILKLNANVRKVVKKAVPKASKIYEKHLMEGIKEYNKKPFDNTKLLEEKIVY